MKTNLSYMILTTTAVEPAYVSDLGSIFASVSGMKLPSNPYAGLVEVNTDVRLVEL